MSIFKPIAAAAVFGAAVVSTPVLAADVAGKWDIVADTQMGQFKSILTVAEDAGAYSVEIVDVPPEDGAGAPPMGEMKSTISDVAVDGDTLTFKRALSGGFEMTLNYKLTVDGDAISGEAGSDFGPTPISGTRAAD